MNIIVIGNPVDGLKFIGPFTTPTDAVEYAQNHCDDAWVVTDLIAQEEDDFWSPLPDPKGWTTSPPTPTMTPSSKYRIRYRIGNQRLTREAVMVFLGDGPGQTLQFSARPMAGTQTLDPSHIIAVQPVEHYMECYMGRIIK